MKIGNIKIEDYLIVHLSHSENEKLNILHEEDLFYSPGLREKYLKKDFHDSWRDLLGEKEKVKFVSGHWNLILNNIDLPHDEWLLYCKERYC